jgi:hypothetical protein
MKVAPKAMMVPKPRRELWCRGDCDGSGATSSIRWDMTVFLMFPTQRAIRHVVPEA